MLRDVAEEVLSRILFSRMFLAAHEVATRRRPVVVDGKRLDASTRFLLSVLAVAGPAPMETLSPERARLEFAKSCSAITPPARQLARVVDVTIEVEPQVLGARVYVPSVGRGLLPGLVYFHGGGWVIGGVETHDRLCRVLADDAGCVVISVDYRLAPECPFPAAADDAKAAFRWIAANASAFGIDVRRLAVGGDSAGGNLAAVVSLAGAGGKGPRPHHQLLIYPVTDLRCDTPSYEHFADGYFLTRSLMHWFRGHYLPSLELVADPDASPLCAEIPRNLPPAYVMTAGYDPLLDEGAAYARKLESAGCDVTYRCYDGLIHGFASMTGIIPAARGAVADATTALRRAFEQP